MTMNNLEQGKVYYKSDGTPIIFKRYLGGNKFLFVGVLVEDEEENDDNFIKCCNFEENEEDEDILTYSEVRKLSDR